MGGDDIPYPMAQLKLEGVDERMSRAQMLVSWVEKVGEYYKSLISVVLNIGGVVVGWRNLK